jgi:predicted nucleotidyltransferase component of viral defense system
MMDINTHKFILLQILKDIYSDIELANWLGFKGGTALMFFYDLPRLSMDLDFNLLDNKKEDAVYSKVKKILFKYGTIFDEAKKYHGSLVVLNYGYGERKLKVEISKRMFDDRYEIKNLLGINIKIMVPEDMFAHKLCTLLDRNTVTNRDIFDCWFFMERRTPVNKNIVEQRMGMPLADYLRKCIEILEAKSDKGLLHGMGELMDNRMKKFVQVQMKKEVIGLMKFYKDFPIVSSL